jgi:polar amino acid transport system substrate-binding protein
MKTRLTIAWIALCLVVIQPARADTFRISAPEFAESEAIFRLLKEVYGRLGHDVERVVRPAKRSLFEVNSGTSDAEMSRVIGAESEFPNLVRVTEPVLALSFSAIVAADSKHWLSSWEEIEKLRIAYPGGYRILDSRTRDMDATTARGPDAVARMVDGGRVDVGILVTSHAHKFASEMAGVSVLDPPIEVVTLYHYLNVKHRRMIPEMEEILIQLNDSGEAKKIIYGD